MNEGETTKHLHLVSLCQACVWSCSLISPALSIEVLSKQHRTRWAGH